MRWGLSRLIIGAAVGAGVDFARARNIDTVVGDVEVLFDGVSIGASGLESEFGKREVNIAEFETSFDASIHVVGAASGVDGDLNVGKVSNGFGAVSVAAVAARAAGFCLVVAELDSEGSGRLTVGEGEDKEESVWIALSATDWRRNLDGGNARKFFGKAGISTFDALGLVVGATVVRVVVGVDEGRLRNMCGGGAVVCGGEEDGAAISGVAHGIVELVEGKGGGGLNNLGGESGRGGGAGTKWGEVGGIFPVVVGGAIFFGIPKNTNTRDTIWIGGLERNNTDSIAGAKSRSIVGGGVVDHDTSVGLDDVCVVRISAAVFFFDEDFFAFVVIDAPKGLRDGVAIIAAAFAGSETIIDGADDTNTITVTGGGRASIDTFVVLFEGGFSVLDTSKSRIISRLGKLIAGGFAGFVNNDTNEANRNNAE